MSEADVLFDTTGGVGRITLNRPQALNALTLDQIHAITPRLEAWAADPAIKVVVVDGAGEKAFCAGGDIRALYDHGKAGDHAAQAAFFGAEYQLNRLIKAYPKPYVALIGGITMGGGVGLSVHGTFRVASERTLFAMPETGIGFYPDVGGTYFLPRCPGRLGTYLALTGARLKAADSLYAGIATHHVPAERLAAVRAELAGAATVLDVKGILDGFHQDPGPAPLATRRDAIDRLFGHDRLSAILSALEHASDYAGDPWAAETLATLRQKSPTALKVTFEQMHRGAKLAFDDAMRLEFRLSMNVTHGHDFYEGVRALIVDKDNQPRWQPAALADVTDDEVQGLFGPTPFGDLDFE